MPPDRDILFVTRWAPRDSGGGTEQRAALHLHALAACGRIHLLYLSDDACRIDVDLRERVATVTTLAPAMARRKTGFSFEHRKGLGSRLFRSAWGMSGLIVCPTADEVSAIVATLPLRQFDAIFAFHLGPACLADALGVLRPGGRQVVDWDFLESANVVPWIRAQQLPSSLWRTAMAHFNRLKVQRLEAGILKSWDAHFCSSSVDVNALRQRARLGRIDVIQNAVPVPAVCPPPSGAPQPTVIFVGTMAYWPNVDAMQHFIDRIWPAVRRALPTAQLLVIGRGMPPALQALHGCEGIEIFSNVHRVEPFYERAHVAVAPLRFAVGSNVKLPEAMAQGRPVVGYRRACERSALGQAQGVFGVDDEAGFATELARLLANPTLGANCGARAHAAALASYSRPVVQDRLARLWVDDVLAA